MTDTTMGASARQMLLILGATVYVAMVGVGIIVPFLPIYASRLGAGGVVMGLVFSSFSLARAVTVPFVGAASDRWGRKPFIIVGLAGYIVAALLLLQVDTAWDLVFNRMGQGLFAAMVLPVVLALVADITPEGMEGRYFGYFNIAFLLGFGTGPLVGGVIYDTIGLDANFLFMAGLSLVSLAAVAVFVREPARQTARAGRPPRLNRAMLGDRIMGGVLVGRVTSAMGMGTFMAFVPVLFDELGLSNTQVGLFLALNVFTMVAMQTPAGWLADRVPRVRQTTAGLLLSGLAKFMLPFCGGLPGMLALSVLEGLAAGLALPAHTALAAARGKDLGAGMGLVMGAFTMALSVGVVLGPPLGGWLTDQGGARWAMFLAGGATMLGALLLALLCAPYWGRGPSPAAPHQEL